LSLYRCLDVPLRSGHREPSSPEGAHTYSFLTAHSILSPEPAVLIAHSFCGLSDTDFLGYAPPSFPSFFAYVPPLRLGSEIAACPTGSQISPAAVAGIKDSQGSRSRCRGHREFNFGLGRRPLRFCAFSRRYPSFGTSILAVRPPSLSMREMLLPSVPLLPLLFFSKCSERNSYDCPPRFSSFEPSYVPYS